MSAVPATDLDSCASEPIRVPGAIQPHGWLLSVAADGGDVVAWSKNWPELLGDELAAPLAAFAAARRGDWARLVDGEGAMSLGGCELGGRALHLSAHRLGELVHLELEESAADAGARAPIYSLARHVVPLMQRATSVDEVCRIVAVEMKRLTGFGRCLVYRFDGDGHGEVLSEALDDGYASYQGHHFPASDIPAQARALYRLNHLRLIPDANYQPVPVQLADGRSAALSLDLSQAQLRSVSPVHLEYMRNMGTLASMSVSIIVRGELWGLVSCHNHEPRQLSYATRMACEHLGQLLSLQVEAKEENEQVSEQARLRQLTLSIVAHMADSDATLQRLVDEPGPLLRLVRAAGAAVILNDQCWRVGETPDADTVLRLGRWLANRIDEVSSSDRLAHDAPAFASQGMTAAGVLAISISRLHRHYVVWFRPEIVQSITWAGEPAKPAAADGRLHPRRSFASWVEHVRGRSAPWRAAEVHAALELRHALIGIVLRRAEEMAEVAGELGRVNKELEAFSYTVSHDLRAPMRHIAGFVDLVLELDGNSLSDRARRYLTHVKEASAHAGMLVDALLDFSRMGRAALKSGWLDTQLLVDDLIEEHGGRVPGGRIEWTVQQPLPRLWADPVLIQVALRNLISNAVKYSRTRNPARIDISVIDDERGVGLAITDNGVGFQMKYVDKLFGVFQRLHRAEAFEGTGIGLASVRRIVERHGGSIEAYGAPDRGARFSFVLPRPETHHA
ncbi:ATP-binding protein [Roseateles asaccharophilus]|uniref:histidine kinase n=1 Tax=Roseateles asaccharophilus TaxID=582607 RepID=A0ABU2AAK9_9BURK|nr:ATP-binding protein [Roseateles asaccharophilus]MDR7334226.1 light-regulated signal transduction histidine kinase (bacteriophytochrome) [Roseateles asaccharophilus]